VHEERGKASEIKWRERGDNAPSLKFNINYQVLIRAVMREPEFI
jgi:hypothetical protein